MGSLLVLSWRRGPLSRRAEDTYYATLPSPFT